MTMRSISNPDTFRKNIRTQLNFIIEDETIATNLEKGVYNYTIKEATTKQIVKKWENHYFTQIYIDRLRSIYINLKTPAILNDLKNGVLTPQRFAFMTHQEMNPDRWEDIIDRKIKRDISKFTNKMEASTDMFTCRKCKSKRCTYYELQTRSADEAATLFITCIDCGKNWTQ
jgi:DNA-directed RNA polymerase subunit M/transcription elongation factor TFIIS